MYRISTAQIFNGGVDRMQTLNQRLNQTEEMVATGQKVNRPSDDPVAAARILRLDQEVTRIEHYQRNLNLAENRLQQEENALSDGIDIMQRIRELTVQAGNGTLTAVDRQSIASEMRERLNQLATAANTQDPSGEFIFSGFKGTTQAFVQDASGHWVYQGDEGQRALEVDEGVNLKIGDHGKGLFVDIPSADPTFFAEASPANNSPGRISMGVVLDQDAFADVYPDDMVIEINGGNYEVRRRGDDPTAPGYTPLATGPYVDGDPIEVAGIRVEVLDGSDGDSFFIKTAGKQSIFTTVERLIYGLENADFTPAQARITDFTPAAGGSSLDINGETFTFAAGEGLAELAEAINTSELEALKGVKAEVNGGELLLTSIDGDIAIDASSWNGDLAVSDSRFQDIDINAGVPQPGTAVTANWENGQSTYEALVASSLTNLDNAQESILRGQTEVGGRLNSLDSTRQFLEDSDLYTKQIRSELRDVDYAEAISNLTHQSFVLQAAQQSFARVSQLSLFDVL